MSDGPYGKLRVPTVGMFLRRGKGRGRGRQSTKGKGRMPGKSDELKALEARLADAKSRTIKGTLNKDTITYLQVGNDDKFMVSFGLIHLMNL